MKRTTELKRKPMKRTPVRRDWTEARAKVEREEVCRLGRDGGCEGKLEAAHVIGREADRFVGLFAIEMETLDASARPETAYSPWRVERERVVPLCTRHHRQYDAHEIDLLGHLTPEEEAQAVLDADGLELARKRLCPTAYWKVAA